MKETISNFLLFILAFLIPIIFFIIVGVTNHDCEKRAYSGSYMHDGWMTSSYKVSEYSCVEWKKENSLISFLKYNHFYPYNK